MIRCAPGSDLNSFFTDSGAGWGCVVSLLENFMKTGVRQSLMLNGSAITFSKALGIVASFAKKVLTWWLVNGAAHESVQALVVFNWEVAASGGKAICSLSHDMLGTADGVFISLNGADAQKKYPGKCSGTKRQLDAGALGSQKLRSLDIGTT